MKSKIVLDISEIYTFSRLVNYWHAEVAYISFDGETIHAIYRPKKLNDIHLYRKLWHLYCEIEHIYNHPVVLYYQTYPAYLGHEKKYRVFKI